MEYLQHFQYKATSQFAKLVTHTFFRQIQVIGAQNIPNNEPVIICSNHNNQFMDGLLLASHLNREIKFIVAAKSMRRPIIGQFSRALGGIPVERAQDLAFQGKGLILKIASTFIEGSQTQFLKQCEVGSTLTISQIDDEFLVTEIISNERINIQRKEKYENPIQISKAYKIIPKLDQTQMYDSVWKALNENQCIGIFPEGGSHDRTDLLPLKAGVCIMALGAMQKYKKHVKIVPCGLNYFSGHKFRSKVVIEFGQAYEIPQEFVEIYSQSRRQAISKLLREIENRLRDVTITVPTYRELNSIFMARRIYLPADREYTPKEELQLNRKFAQGYIKKIEDPRVQEMLEKIRQYSTQLKNLGTQDYEIKKYNSSLKIDYKSLATLIIKTLFSMGFSFPAIILNSPIAVILRYLSERERVKCQKSSKVKVLGKDVVASYQVMCAFIILPIANTLYTFIFRYLLKNKCKYFKNKSLKLVTALFFLLYPIYTFIMINAADSISLNIRAIKAKFLFITRKEQLKKLREYREQIYIEIRDFIKEQSRSELKSSGSLLSLNDLHSQQHEISIGQKSISIDHVDGFFDVLEEIGC